jgi:hypothetical protein
MRFLLTALIFFLAGATLAHADGELDRRLTPADRDRLARFDASLAEALGEARAGGSIADRSVLEAVLAGQPLPLGEGYDPTGPWRCRTLKLGGGLPLTIYGWFKCRIRDDGAGWMLEKLTGSQRTQGRFYTLSATRLAYVGAGHVASDAPRAYGADPQEDQVAYVERRGPNRLLLLFPAPHYESKFDILELER